MADEARDLSMAALREYQAWAALDRDNPEAELQVAQSYFNIDRTKEAQARLETARRRFPRDAAIRERLIAYYILGLDQDQARRLCQEWLREEPGSPQVLWLLGRAAEASQQYAETVRLYEQALAKEPDNLAWVGTLGVTLLTLSDTDAHPEERAVAALARAATGDPDEPRWRLALAQGLQRLGRIEEARRQALRALDLGPRESRAYNLLVQCARQERAAGPLSLFAGLLREVEARQREEQSLRHATWERPRDPDAYAALAEFLLHTGNPAAAESQWAEAARLRPDWPKVRARLAMVRRLREDL
jgi:Flp pilus assembly protein TadD